MWGIKCSSLCVGDLRGLGLGGLTFHVGKAPRFTHFREEPVHIWNGGFMWWWCVGVSRDLGGGECWGRGGMGQGMPHLMKLAWRCLILVATDTAFESRIRGARVRRVAARERDCPVPCCRRACGP